MIIEIADDLRPRINGTAIVAAPTVPELHALMGPPSRVVDPVGSAPVGHRNSQIHVYDAYGIYFNEHHYTRRIGGGTIVFWPEEQGYRFTPTTAFGGTLPLAGYQMPIRAALAEFLKACPIPFRSVLGGMICAEQDQFVINIDSKGAELPSGKRSKVRHLVDLSLSWPHDPWRRPTDIGPGAANG